MSSKAKVDLQDSIWVDFVDDEYWGCRHCLKKVGDLHQDNCILPFYNAIDDLKSAIKDCFEPVMIKACEVIEGAALNLPPSILKAIEQIPVIHWGKVRDIAVYIYLGWVVVLVIAVIIMKVLG